MSTPSSPTPDRFDDLLADLATGDAPPGVQGDESAPADIEAAAAVLHRALAPRATAPASLKARLNAEATKAVSTAPATTTAPSPVSPGTSARRWKVVTPWLAAAACLTLAGVVVLQPDRAARDRRDQLDNARAELTVLQARVQANEHLLAAAQRDSADLMRQLENSKSALTEQQRITALAEAANLKQARELAELTSDLGRATAELDRAALRIAEFERPIDPATLQQNRTKLLDVPGTVRLAWTPFDLPNAPAEQREVQGDVVWNDDLQQGFLRFVGLKVNDPNVEQYQVWVIDERGMEQKVSGGVFNASADGEVIVPIHPGIDVGRVAVFAITVEKPGGTWVPDLLRRIVVAPRG